LGSDSSYVPVPSPTMLVGATNSFHTPSFPPTTSHSLPLLSFF
jgi:hypothetical protein